MRAEIVRILELWAQARARHGSGGPYLFGTFGAADIMFAPVVTRFVTYSDPRPPLRRGLYGGDPRPRLDAGMDRGGAGGALGDRADTRRLRRRACRPCG